MAGSFRTPVQKIRTNHGNAFYGDSAKIRDITIGVLYTKWSSPVKILVLRIPEKEV